ncbi:hypothetical protein [Engelhardtia mirabilis]|uniref:Uncharacterized protein n=1 Tax=Engelhardtia mirabilis TaxID=2528011 RepID=A0A518BI26_9BACT|nr:hypothetical protein Pla133_16910 [Planctomycetes bacterium Pla133]QDV00941.1 hypothetical protein Pla86_16900 [Planctomycetes bacterium Pla86]
MQSLEFRCRGLLARHYDVLRDGRKVALLDRSVWGEGATIELEGVDYQMRARGFLRSEIDLARGGEFLVSAVRPSVWSSTFELRDLHPELAFTGTGEELEDLMLTRSSLWCSSYEINCGRRRIGSMTRTSLWSRGAVLESREELPLVLAVFIGSVVISLWARQAAVAAT